MLRILLPLALAPLASSSSVLDWTVTSWPDGWRSGNTIASWNHVKAHTSAALGQTNSCETDISSVVWGDGNIWAGDDWQNGYDGNEWVIMDLGTTQSSQCRRITHCRSFCGFARIVYMDIGRQPSQCRRTDLDPGMCPA